MTDAAAEQRVLKLSVVLSGVLGVLAVAVGLLSGSMSIVFDGLVSVIDVAMGGSGCGSPGWWPGHPLGRSSTATGTSSR